MDKELIIKYANNTNIIGEIEKIGFDPDYIQAVAGKYHNNQYKIFHLKAHEANILKQLCLSLGFDCAVNRGTIMCRCDYTDAIINATQAQYKSLVKKLHKQPFRLKELAQKLDERLNNKLKPLVLKNTALDWSKPYIMGVLNVTPDSFSDGGDYFSIEAATNRALALIEDGADIIDIGGESTRPKSNAVPAEEETERILPIIKNIRKINQSIPISIDTRNGYTASEAIKAGADIVNDVTALEYSEELFNFVTTEQIPIIIMHSTQIPATSESYCNECDLIDNLYQYFYNKIKLLNSKGLSSDKIIIDPGIGFSKSIEGNFEIIKRFNEFKSLNVANLAGISRKSFIKKSLGLEAQKLDEATVAYNSILINKGANIIRVHNVKKHKENLNYLSKLL